MKKKPSASKSNGGDKYALLADACGGDPRCTCVMGSIFKHDSGWATKGIGAKTNNPGNMRPPALWKPSVPMGVYHAKGNGKFAQFDTLKDGITANVELYRRHYADAKTADALVRKWAQTKNPDYYNAVRPCYL